MPALALLLGSLALAAGGAPHAAVAEPSIDGALHLLYDGSTDAALASLASLAARSPEDPLPVYFEALAFAWKVEQRPETRAQDARLLALADRAIRLADERLRSNAAAAGALFARGAAHGVKSRLHLFRRDKRASAREAVRMREDLRRLLHQDPDHEDARFGLALYDYYADVLPRMLKLMRMLAGLPGGDRERGLAGLERAAERARWHRSEAVAQLYEIYAFYEEDPDAALEALLALRERYPGSPLWGLKLTDHLRDRLSLYGRAAEAAREIVELAQRGHPNYAPVVARMAEIALGHALLLDLRFDEARRALSRAGHDPLALLLLGRSFELEGRRASALPHYRAAQAAAAAPDVARAARDALEKPLPRSRVAATPALARGRRLHEAGRSDEAAAAFADALHSWPESHEAALRVAAGEIKAGRDADARKALEDLLETEHPEPYWVRPEAALLLARLREAEDRSAAVALYKQVWKHPGGMETRRLEARLALERLGASGGPAPRSRRAPKHSR